MDIAFVLGSLQIPAERPSWEISLLAELSETETQPAEGPPLVNSRARDFMFAPARSAAA